MGSSTPASRPYETLSSETRFRCPYWHMIHDRYRLPSGAVTDYFFVRTGGSTMVIPVEADGRLVLVRQHRYLLGRDSLEFPCGGVPVGEDPVANAEKELREETGFRARDLRRIGEFAPYNGVADEICHVYLARDLFQVGVDPDATESIEVVRQSPADVEAAIASGEIWDGMTLAACTIAREKLELFRDI